MTAELPNTFADRGRLYTRNLGKGDVYGERIIKRSGVEFRQWSPAKSKLAEYLRNGGNLPLKRGDHLLYLGAASGTTASHLSDVLADGRIFAVEFSPIPFFKLTNLAGKRSNIVPILSDASHPDRFAPFVDRADALYQDIAQKDQVEIFIRNMERFSAPWGVIMVKTRSISHRPTDAVVRKELAKFDGYELMEVDISSQHPDHRAWHVQPKLP